MPRGHREALQGLNGMAQQTLPAGRYTSCAIAERERRRSTGRGHEIHRARLAINVAVEGHVGRLTQGA